MKLILVLAALVAVALSGASEMPVDGRGLLHNAMRYEQMCRQCLMEGRPLVREVEFMYFTEQKCSDYVIAMTN